MKIQVIRLYTGPDGESHFEDIKIPLDDDIGVIRQSKLAQATGIGFAEMYNINNSDWHPALRRQYVIILDGILEIEIGDGTKRQFRPGGIFLAEDTTGRGHLTRMVNNQSILSVSIALD